MQTISEQISSNKMLEEKNIVPNKSEKSEPSEIITRHFKVVFDLSNNHDLLLLKKSEELSTYESRSKGLPKIKPAEIL